MPKRTNPESVVREIRRKTRRQLLDSDKSDRLVADEILPQEAEGHKSLKNMEAAPGPAAGE